MKTSGAIAIEHESTHRDGTVMRTRWCDTRREAEAIRSEYVAAGAEVSGVCEDGGCLGRFRVWAHFAPSLVVEVQS